MSEAELRRFEKSDLQGLQTFLAHLFESMGRQLVLTGKDIDIADITAHYVTSGGMFFVIDSPGGIMGCAGLRPSRESIAELKRLYLSPHLRSQGLGERLCRAILEHGRSVSYSAIRLDTTEESAEAIRLFRKLGFRDIPRYNDDTFATIFMELRL